MSQSSSASSGASGCASEPSSNGSGADLRAPTSLAVADPEDTAATASAALSIFACSSIDGDRGSGAPPALRNGVGPLGTPLISSSTVTVTMMSATDEPYRAPEALPSLLLQPKAITEQLRGLAADASVAEYECITVALLTAPPPSLSASRDDAGSGRAASPSMPSTTPASSASCTVVGYSSTSQHRVTSSLPSVALVPSPESSTLPMSAVAESDMYRSDLSGPSPTCFLSPASHSSSLSIPWETAVETRIIPFDSAGATAREECPRPGSSPRTRDAIASPTIRHLVASSGGQGATCSPSQPPALHLMSATTREEIGVAVQLPSAETGEGGVTGGEAPVGLAEVHAARGSASLAEPSFSFSSLTLSMNAGDDPKADSGAALEVPIASTTPPARLAEATEKLLLPKAPTNSDKDRGGHEGNEGDLRTTHAAPPVAPNAAKVPPASRKRRRVALAGPDRQPRRAARRTDSEKAAQLVERAPSPLPARAARGPLLATAAECTDATYVSEDSCKQSASIQTHTPAVVLSEGEWAHEERRLDVLRTREEAHDGEAGGGGLDGAAASNNQEGLTVGVQKCVVRFAREDYGEPAETATDPCQTEVPAAASTGCTHTNGNEEAPVMSPPPSSAETGANTGTSHTTITPSPVSNLRTETSTLSSVVSSVKSKKSSCDAPLPTAAHCKAAAPGALMKETTATAPLPASSKPVLNLAGVNLQALLAEGTDPPPLYTRRQRRTRRRSVLDEDHPLFAEHRGLWEHDTTGRILPRAPFASDADVLSSLTEWTDSPPLVYAQLLWRYAPALFLNLAMHDSDSTPYAKVEPKVEADICVKKERIE
ncbi:hypothetical protein GH5_02739 [Leishmania sp. Ghana 2012 LV757]|uniref:hypothetical protein n=1 Tax=Leishmania sp. Ghana 2012 LV757 TaxID=2803181 RepID=UPI001B723873|nr:hypothetical protein GH5_02739 [Leishmania sp. Ghana 2012 LV757]